MGNNLHIHISTMGAGNSKPEDGLSQHVFKSGTPTRYSGDFVGSLQDSTNSDTTRTANLELKIQSRVTSELERLAAEESEKLKSLASSISKEAESSPSPSSSSESTPTLSDKLSGTASEKEKKAQLSHGSVSQEIADLKKKLGGRRKVEQVDEGVTRAKEELVQCLRVNDRRPLDCWKEREAFKREVGRLEREFVERTVR